MDSAEACCEQCLQYKPKSASDQTCNGGYAWLCVHSIACSSKSTCSPHLFVMLTCTGIVMGSVGVVRRERGLRGTVPRVLVEASGNPSRRRQTAHEVLHAGVTWQDSISVTRACRPTQMLQHLGKGRLFPGQRE